MLIFLQLISCLAHFTIELSHRSKPLSLSQEIFDLNGDAPLIPNEVNHI